MNVYQIHSKFNAEIFSFESLMIAPNFSQIVECIWELQQFVVSVWKEE